MEYHRSVRITALHGLEAHATFKYRNRWLQAAQAAKRLHWRPNYQTFHLIDHRGLGGVDLLSRRGEVEPLGSIDFGKRGMLAGFGGPFHAEQIGTNRSGVQI